MNASVIIPTYNRSQALLRCLNALIEQRGDVGSFEIVVVDDGSTDDTARMVTGLAAKSPVEIRLVELGSHAGPAAARNRGITAATSEIVVFIGDDIIVQPGFLKWHCAMRRRFRSARNAILGYTTWHPELEITPFMRWLESSGLQFDYPWIERYGPTWRHFYTSNISLERGFLLQNGLFDETFKAAAFEDIDLGFRLAKHGLRILYCPQAAAYHLHTSYGPDRTWARRMTVRGFYEMLFERKYAELSEALDRKLGLWRQILLASLIDEKAADRVSLATADPSRIGEDEGDNWMEAFGSSAFEVVATFHSRRGAVSLLSREYPGLRCAARHYASATEAEKDDDLNRAFAEAIAARRAEPGLVSLAFLTADLFARHGKVDAAARQYRDVLRARPNHVYANLQLAELLRCTGKDADRARRTYKAVLDRGMVENDSRSLAHIGLGMLGMTRNAPKAALRSFRRACAVAPPDANLRAFGLIHSAEACEALGRREEAHRLLVQVDDLGFISPTTRAHASFSKSELLRLEGQLPRALRLLDEARMKCAGDDSLLVEIEFKMGQVELERKRRKRALDHFKTVASMQAPPQLVNQAASLAADMLVDERRFDEALSYLREVVSGPVSGDLLGSARARIGSILFEKQDFEGALGEFRSATEAGSKDKQLLGWAFFSMGFCCKELRRHEEARRHFAKSQRLLSDPEMLVSSVWEQAHLAYGRRQPGGAIRRFESGIESLIRGGRCSQEVGFRSVMALHDARAFDAASRLLKSLSKVIDLDRRFWRLALAYKRRGFLSSVEDVMSSLEFLPPSEQAEWHLSAASLLLEMGYDQDAEDEVRSALRQRSGWPQANYVLGSILEKRCSFDEASARFEAVLDHEVSVGKDLWSRIIGGAHYHLACIFERSGEKEKALEHIESCLEIMPKHRKAMELRLSLLSVAAPVSG